MSRQEIMTELREWKELLDEAIVTREEYETHRQNLLTQLKEHSVTSSPGVSQPSVSSGVSFFGTGGQQPSTSSSPQQSAASFFQTGGIPEHPPQGQAGQTLAGRYHLERLLGVGGMGEVYKATDALTNSPCALKWIRPELASQAHIRKRFVQELQVTQRLSHPGIVRTYALSEDKERGVLFFTMEYVEGESLEDLLTRAETERRLPPVTLEQTMDWLKTLAEALAVAHDEGVLHRDLKPANIMVDKRGKVRLMDFGIAKAIGPVTQFHTGYVGTPVYMPPEQFRGGKATIASDLYSFGVVAYQLLTGTLPQGRFEEPRELNPDIPHWLNRMVLRCLHRQPERRYPDVDTLFRDWQTGKTPQYIPSDELITDVTGLTVEDVANKRVLCPACGEKEFKRWPSGWDAHSEHRCKGLAAIGKEERKREFKERYRHLFR
jgi:serine/threonine protein kinase